MNNKIIFLLVAFCIIFLGGCSGGSSTLTSSTQEFLDNTFAAMIGDDDIQVPGLGVIAFKDGQILYENFFGKRELEKNLPMTKDTRLRVASISKMFTVFGIMQLVAAGKIDLDEDVSVYLGFTLRNPNFPDDKITVRMLASHTSTLRDGDSYSLLPQYTLEEFFREGGVKYENGAHFADKDKSYFTYCNLNYGVLGTIIERVSGERFDAYQKEHVLRPMEIYADYVVGNLGDSEFDNLGAIYRKEDGKWAAQVDSYETQPAHDTVWDNQSISDYKIGTNATIFAPQGGLRISFKELGNCLEMMINNGTFRGTQIVREDLFNEMCKPQWIYDNDNGDPYDVMFSYGLGLYQIDGAGKARLCENHDIDLIGHSGEAYGLISGAYFRPGMKDGAIFMINGVGVEEGVDERSFGKFSNSFIWEEQIMNPICEKIFVGN